MNIFNSNNVKDKSYKDILKIIIISVILVGIVVYLNYLNGFIYWFINIIYPFIIGCAIAFVINIPLNFIENKLIKKKFKNKRALSLFISIIFVIGILVVVMIIILPRLFDIFIQLKNQIPKIYNFWIEKLDNYNSLKPYIKHIKQNYTSNDFYIGFEQILGFLRNGNRNIINSFLSTFSSILNIIVNFIISLVFAMYILASKEKLYKNSCRFTYAILKEHLADKIYYFLHILSENFKGFIKGQVTDVTILASLCFIFMSIANMPYSIMISTIVLFLGLIPMFGSIIATFIGFVIIFIDSPTKAIIFVVVMIIILQIDSNFIYPKIVGKNVGLPPMFTLIAIVVGGASYGILGIWIAIPLLSSLYFVIKVFSNRKLKENKIDIDGKPDYSFIKNNADI